MAHYDWLKEKITSEETEEKITRIKKHLTELKNKEKKFVNDKKNFFSEWAMVRADISDYTHSLKRWEKIRNKIKAGECVDHISAERMTV